MLLKRSLVSVCDCLAFPRHRRALIFRCQPARRSGAQACLVATMQCCQVLSSAIKHCIVAIVTFGFPDGPLHIDFEYLLSWLQFCISCRHSFTHSCELPTKAFLGNSCFGLPRPSCMPSASPRRLFPLHASSTFSPARIMPFFKIQDARYVVHACAVH
jgi:hypothetical protein